MNGMRRRWMAGLYPVMMASVVIAAGCGDTAMDGGGDLAAGPGADLAAGGGDGGGGGGDGSSSMGDGGGGNDDAAVGCVKRTCQGKTYQCGDCVDNDKDGRIDSDDTDCLGACQNNEGGFYGDIPGQNNAPCKADCYFDQDTGSGNDKCEWDHQCDPHEVPPNFPPESGCTYDPKTKFPGGQSCADKEMAQDPMCKTICAPLTPNGCDCFGCCVIPPNQSQTDGVWLGSRDANGVPVCDLEHANDPMRCKPCKLVNSCWKPCGRCQLCIGKDTVPDDCLPKDAGGGGDGGGGDKQCPGGEDACGLPGQPPCKAAYYCITGCCQPIIN